MLTAENYISSLLSFVTLKGLTWHKHPETRTLGKTKKTENTDYCDKPWVTEKEEPIPLSSGVSGGAYVRVKHSVGQPRGGGGGGGGGVPFW